MLTFTSSNRLWLVIIRMMILLQKHTCKHGSPEILGGEIIRKELPSYEKDFSLLFDPLDITQNTFMMSSTTPVTTDTAAPGDLPMRMDGWTHHAKTYSNVERMTYPLAIELAEWTDSVLPFTTPNSRVLDNGCGGGVLGSAIKTLCPTVPLLSTDVSAGMISSARARAEKERWEPPYEFKTLDARDLDGVESKSITHSMSQYMISLAPDPDQIAREMHRVLKPGGALGLGTWAMVDYECFYDPMLIAARETIPDFDLPGLMHEKWTDIEKTRRALKEAGFTDVQVRPKDIEWEVS